MFELLHFVHVFIKDVLADIIWTFELLPTEWAKVLALCQLLSVELHKPLLFSARESRQPTLEQCNHKMTALEWAFNYVHNATRSMHMDND